ncbi:MAG: hypothetical protein IJ071_09640 [Ruminococcus sp.]|nr:hypothetical protein [Ruminococcus sp.]
MSDQKLSLEDILDQYTPEDEEAPAPHVGRVDAQKIINQTIAKTEAEAAAAAQQKPVSHEKNELFDGAKRSQEPANEFKPADLSKKTVAFVSSDGLSEIRSAPVKKPAVEAPAPVQGEAPKIRRMTESTRAREAEKMKTAKRSKRKRSSYTYRKETPDGEFIYDPPQVQKKKRSRRQIIDEAENPENRLFTTDIVPSPAALEAARPVEPAPRAEKTSIDLTQRPEVDASDLDVHITQETEEYVKASTHKKRTKRIVDFNYYGDVEDVGRDIFELKGIISTRVATLALASFLSLYMTICSQFELPIIEILSIKSITTYLLAHLVLGAISLLISAPVISKGVKNLFLLKADSDSMTAMTAIVCIISLVTAFFRKDMALAQTIHIYMPVGILALFINAAGKDLIIRRAARNFRFVSKEFDRHGVVYVRDEERAERLTRGTLGDFPILAKMRRTDFLTDFLRYTYSSDITDAFCKRAAPACLIFSALVSVFLTLFRMGTLASVDSAAFGFSIFSMMICASSCISMPFVVNIPLEQVSRKALKNKGIMLGYQSVDDLYDCNCVLVDADTLFPERTVKLGGIKVFSNTKIDEALLEAASLATHAGSIMRQLFADVTAGKEDILYPIENFSIEEGMGLCGWTNNKRILLGSRELMTSHNIEGIPSKANEAEFTAGGQKALYLSVSGNLAAMFIVDIAADRYVKRWAKRLCKSKVFLIVKSIDPCVTAKLISSLFGVPEGMVRVLPQKLHEDFDYETRKATRLSASMACTGRFSSLAQLILGTKIVHSSAVVGLILQTASILLGLGLCMLLILSKAFEFDYFYMSAFAMIIYNAAWAILTYIGVSIKKL